MNIFLWNSERVPSEPAQTLGQLHDSLHSPQCMVEKAEMTDISWDCPISQAAENSPSVFRLLDAFTCRPYLPLQLPAVLSSQGAAGDGII